MSAKPRVAPKAPHQHRTPAEYSTVLAKGGECNNVLHAFATMPPEVGYESLLEGEKILLLLRQHPITNFHWILLSVVMLITPFVLLPFFPPFVLLPAAFKFVLMLFWLLFTFGFVLERFLVWFYNCFLITDERVIDIDFFSLVFKHSSYAQIDKIQDVDTQVGGVVYSLLDVGDVIVQTASEIPQFEINKVPHPSQVAKLLNELIYEEEQEKIEGRTR